MFQKRQNDEPCGYVNVVAWENVIVGYFHNVDLVVVAGVFELVAKTVEHGYIGVIETRAAPENVQLPVAFFIGAQLVHLYHPDHAMQLTEAVFQQIVFFLMSHDRCVFVVRTDTEPDPAQLSAGQETMKSDEPNGMSVNSGCFFKKDCFCISVTAHASSTREV